MQIKGVSREGDAKECRESEARHEERRGKRGKRGGKARVVKSKVVYKRMTRHCCSRRERGLAEGRKRRVEWETDRESEWLAGLEMFGGKSSLGAAPWDSHASAMQYGTYFRTRTFDSLLKSRHSPKSEKLDLSRASSLQLSFR